MPMRFAATLLLPALAAGMCPFLAGQGRNGAQPPVGHPPVGFAQPTRAPHHVTAPEGFEDALERGPRRQVTDPVAEIRVVGIRAGPRPGRAHGCRREPLDVLGSKRSSSRRVRSGSGVGRLGLLVGRCPGGCP